MKVHFTFIFTLLVSIGSLQAQTENASLLLQSPDGKTVKLMWFFKSWNKDITGFDIKRRESAGTWIKLNKAAIKPEVAANKDLSIVESDNAEAARIKAKVSRLITDKKLRETSNSSYLQKLNSDPDALQSIAFVIALDYDMALANGFGFIDRTISQKGKYEYGLFIDGTDRLLASASWQYGSKPDLDIVRNISSIATAKKGKIELKWEADTVKMQASYVAGFNLYREGKKINENPVMAAGSTDLSVFIWSDSGVNNPTQYAISAVTIFGIEGQQTTYKFVPSEHPGDYKAGEITDISSAGDNFANGINISWTFPKDYEGYLSGFYIEKDNLPQGFKKISELISPLKRSYTDKTPSPASTYIKYRIIAVYKDQANLESAEKLFYYFLMLKPPKPKNLKAKWIKDNGKMYAELTWDAAPSSDTLTESYMIYASNPIDHKFYQEAGIEPVKDNHYKYPVQYENTSNYKFCVSALSKNKIESELSDTVSVIVPSQQLPYPVIEKISLDSNRVTIKWSYPDIWDIKGFRVFQNGNIVASEYELKKGSTQFVTPGLKWGSSYSFTLQAVTQSGVESGISVPAFITIQTTTKK